jgi:hypothetical protein
MASMEAFLHLRDHVTPRLHLNNTLHAGHLTNIL